MTSHKTTHRWALWAFAVALLLKSAMPWLASASADLQGKTLVEVCTVYGVSYKALGGEHGDDRSQPAGEHDAGHEATQCALDALGALASFDAPPVLAFGTAPPSAEVPRRTLAAPRAHDAVATWAARLRHGPPTFA